MSNQNSDNTLVIVGIVGGVLLLGFLVVVALFVGAGFFWVTLPQPPTLQNPPLPTTTVPTTTELLPAESVDSVVEGSEPKLPTWPQPDDSPHYAGFFMFKMDGAISTPPGWFTRMV